MVVNLLLIGIAVLTVVATLDSCSASIPLPEESNLSILPEDLRHLSLLDLRKGRELYIENCGGCHRLYGPGEKTFAEWAEVYNDMGGKVHQTALEKQKLLAYLRAAAKLPADTSSRSH